ncbi:MAG: hypothetical protein WC979_06645 [Candidatus Pacearchaeota archaeon]|jgi:hypothetical protein
MDKLEIIPHKKTKYPEGKIIAIILFVCAGLIWVPIPIPDKASIAALLCLILGIYHLFK